MAAVYVARHTRLGHVVALKIPHLDYQQDDRFLKRFVDEARIQANLRHPNILAVQDILEMPAASGIVMELLSGCSLKEYYRDVCKPLPPARATKLFIDLVEALKYAHDGGVVHRDLKPANVFLHVSKDSVTPKIMDFGIAKFKTERMGAGVTDTGSMLGTPEYMAPEQFEDSAKVDHRADIFALGVMMYEGFAGAKPFEGDSVGSLLRSIYTTKPAPPSTVFPRLPVAVDRVVMTCLEIERDNRLESAGALLEELRELSRETGVDEIAGGDIEIGDLSRFGIEAKPRFTQPVEEPSRESLLEGESAEISLAELAGDSGPAEVQEEPDTIADDVRADSEEDDPAKAAPDVSPAPAGKSLSSISMTSTSESRAHHTRSDLAAFRILEKIYEGRETIVYKGASREDGKPVVIKVPAADYPGPGELARLKHEFQLASSLDMDGVTRVVGLEKYRNGLALVAEDFGGEPLKDVMKGEEKPAVASFLRRAIRLAEILGQLHERGVVHKDVNPKNILVNSGTGEIRIIDFGLASHLPRAHQGSANPHTLEGTIAYISPEQTGRMNRAVDYRTDFYSLGVTFYEMLTGRLPFQTEDRTEMVHCHMARQPVSPRDLDRRVPGPVSDIVMKLLAKTAEERYQSALGFLKDLEHCLAEFDDRGDVAEFVLGSHDVSEKLRIPEKLYGREEEVGALLANFKRVTQGYKEMMMVSGYAGIGKTSLVREIYKPVTRQRGYFITGKFDQYKRDVPFGALIEAFQELVRALLTEGDDRLASWRNEILGALGPNGQVIINVIPDVEKVIGRQPAVPELPAAESHNRLTLAFHSFMNVFTREEHPLVLFLDDLQWADNASLALLQSVMTGPENDYLFIVGAYRDNEVDAAHPLVATLEELEKMGIPVADINLGALRLEHINELISDTFAASPGETMPLAELARSKTHGNPFFLTEFLKAVHAKELVRFDFMANGWTWNLEAIGDLGIGDDVVELMAEKIQALPAACQQALKLGACIGGGFDLQLLATVSGKSPSEIMTALDPAVREGFLLVVGETHRFLQLDGKDLADGLLDAVLLRTVRYKFGHDKIQQAAYSLIPEEIRKTVHRQVGQIILRETAGSKREARVFDIVNQLNASLELLQTPEEKEELAHLNLLAGKKALSSSGYESAYGYLASGISLMEEDAWETKYELTLELHVEAATAAYLSTRFQEMERLANIVLERGKELIDKVRAYEVLIHGHIAQARKLEAVDTGLTLLRLLGVKVPPRPSMAQVLLAVLRTKVALIGKSPESLLDLPPMKDEKALAAMRVATSLASTAYVLYPNLFPVLVLTQVQLSVKYGNMPFSSFAYALYGVVLCGALGDLDGGYRFGQVGMKLQRKLEAHELRGKVPFTAAGFTEHYKKPLRKCNKRLLDAYKSSLELGDFEFAGTSSGVCAYNMFYLGLNLVELEGRFSHWAEVLVQCKQVAYVNYMNIYLQVVKNLLSESSDPSRLEGEAYSVSAKIDEHHEANDFHALGDVYLARMVLSFTFGDFAAAVQYGDEGEQYLHGLMAMYASQVWYFYDSLSRLALCRTALGSDRRGLLKKVRSNVRKLKKWARHCEENQRHKLDLVLAERARVAGKSDLAMELYDKAIEGANRNGFLSEQALGNELAAAFYLALGKNKIARAYMTDAHYLYKKWGATAKVEQIEDEFDDLVIAETPGAAGIFESTSTISSESSTTVGTSRYDVSTVLKAAQAISGEINLPELLKKLMAIVVENAGAQRGLLVLESEDRLLVEADVPGDGAETTVMQHEPIRRRTDVAQTVINYVLRMREPVVLDDAGKDGTFGRDEYVGRVMPKSLLCMPLMHQARLSGVLYLENNLAVAAFTPGRVELLEMLSAEIVISLRNAELYGRLEEHARLLEQKVSDRTMELTAANEALAKEKSKSDALLLNVLPAKVADDLRRDGRTEPESFKYVSALFTDFVEFTPMTALLEPAALIDELNDIFTAFDSIIERNRCERIKTIGDAYLAVCGMPQEDPLHAGNMVKAALEIKEYLEKRNAESRLQWRARIGVHSGKVVGGVVGVKKYIYDVFGDTINTASRVQDASEPMRVNISEATYRIIKDDFVFEERGPIEVKGKGRVRMHFVEGSRN